MSVFSGLANIGKVPELRRRLLFTLGMLAVYRVGVFVTIPGVDRNVMQAVMSKQGGGLLGLFNLFSGGALGNLSIFGMSLSLEALNNGDLSGAGQGDVVTHPGWAFRVMSMLTLTTGTAFIMWV